MKAVLIDFHKNHTHTMRLDPGHPAVRFLVGCNVLAVGTGGGTYDAVDRYLTVKPNIWELMEDWVINDAAALAIIQEQFFEPVDHD